VDQRDERLDVAVTERLVRGAHRFNSHENTIAPARLAELAAVV
jgi:hypothetical protein